LVVLGLYYARNLEVVFKIYGGIKEELKFVFTRIASEKDKVTTARSHLAHPTISDDDVKKFLKELRAGSAGLPELAQTLFNYLSLETNTPENKKRARGH
jgi:hypothetical protein